MATTVDIPQDEGELTAREVSAYEKAQNIGANLASDMEIAGKAQKLVTNIVTENDERMMGLKRRWRGIYYMLSGNTLEKGGPEDVHVPELYKAAETIVPRVEEQIVERQPWFRMVPRRSVNKARADANEAYLDWQFSQARIRDLVQPYIRDTLFTQIGVFYVQWKVEEKMVAEREVVTSTKDGKLKKTVKVSEPKKKVTFFGPKVSLIDPFDFIIETKATNVQEANYVGHRAYMTVDQVKETGRRLGWINLDALDGANPGTTIATQSDWYSWPRDPTARYKTRFDETQPSPDGRPSKVEVVMLYVRASFDEGSTYDDYRVVLIGGKVIAEVRVNPLDKQYRPYAVARSSKSGHEFFSTGTFDNAVRLNQHADAYQQLFLSGAKLCGAPMGFAEEDSDIPDTLYRIRPGQILKGVGPIRFTQIPDGFLRAYPMVMGSLQKNIEEVVGAFRINMGQDTGGTATEASLSLQEGNRRTRGLVRAVADGLEQLLQIFHRMNNQFSVDDVEFPVIGKRALAMRKTTVNISPADLLDDVEFDMVGLHNSRNYGLRATGYQALLNAGAPFMMANMQNVDTLGILHDLVSELVGPDEADRYIKIPTPIEDLRSQREENEALLAGADIEVDAEDDDEAHMKEMAPLWRRASDPKSDMPKHVRQVVAKHWVMHEHQRAKKKAQKAVMDRRAQMQGAMAPPEAGGMQSQETGRSSPMAGGMSAGMEDLGQQIPGQTAGENPGPSDIRKGGRSGRRGSTINQTQNVASEAM